MENEACIQVAALEVLGGLALAVIIFLLFSVFWGKSSLNKAVGHLVGRRFSKQLLFPTLLSVIVFLFALTWVYIGWELCRIV